jgi:hypothetical protein
MIERSAYIESSVDWFRHRLAIPNDRLLSAFVSLRLITSAHTDLEVLQFRPMLRLLDRRIEGWQKTWQEVVTGDREDCHAFLVPFYGTYARLLLFTLTFHASLKPKDITISVDTEEIWNSGSSALSMLNLVSKVSTSQLLYFAQDSVHVMIAYATVFLVKVPASLYPRLDPANTSQLLVSAPTHIRSEMERPAMEAIRSAAKTLTEQAAPPNTGCALQANFLYNVALEYEASREPSCRSRSYGRGPSHVDNPRTTAAPSRTLTLHVRTIPSYPTVPDSHLEERAWEDRDLHEIDALSQDMQDIETPAIDSIQDLQDTTFSDGTKPLTEDEVWAIIFANAGFNVNAGAFMLPT